MKHEFKSPSFNSTFLYISGRSFEEAGDDVDDDGRRSQNELPKPRTSSKKTMNLDLVSTPRVQYPLHQWIPLATPP